MINTSNEYRKTIMEERQFRLKATLTFRDGTIFNLEDKDIFQNGMTFDEATSDKNSFQIGYAYIGCHKLVLDNFDGKFDDYDFSGATVVPYVGLQLSESVEYLKKGFFTVDDPGTGGNIITLICYDNMHKFARPFSEIEIVFPTTVQNLLVSICLHCGVPLATPTFDNDDYVINERPVDDALSCLDMISYIGQVTGNFAKCNINGALEMKWYDTSVFEQTDSVDGGRFDSTDESSYQSGDSVDGGNFIDYTSGDIIDGGTFEQMKRYHHFYDFGSIPSVSVDDVVITGIKVSFINGEETYTKLFGSDGYVLSIEKNPLIQSKADVDRVANMVGAKIVGMKFRPFSANVLSDPSVEAGDPCYISLRTSRGYVTYQSFITSLNYTVSQRMKISCDSESPTRNSSVKYSVETKTIVEARKETNRKIKAYDLMVKQLNDLVAHSFGVYKSEEVLEDGSVIYYMHDKPTLAESQKIWKQTADAFAVSTDGGKTFTAGFDAEGNAVFNVLAAIGIHADWIRAGKLYSTDGSTLIDMQYGVANSDNLSFVDNIQDGFPLIMPFNIDDKVSKINQVLLKFSQQNFRTYSKTAESGGESVGTTWQYSATSALTNYAQVSGTVGNASANITISGGEAAALAQSSGSYSGSTGETTAQSGTAHSHSLSIPNHTHLVIIPEHSHTASETHSHSFTGGTHAHTVTIPGHNHTVEFPAHTHDLDFGIQEKSITNYALDIYVDGVLRVQIENSPANAKGIVDLTQWITTIGWHEIEIRSNTLKRVSAQLNIKSYIRS